MTTSLFYIFLTYKAKELNWLHSVISQSHEQGIFLFLIMKVMSILIVK